LILAAFTPSARAEQNARKAFAFAGPQCIITAEVASPHSFVVNFINLSDFVLVLQPNEFIYRGASDRFYIGQVYQLEHKDTRGESWKYSASVLLKGRSFTGLTIVGSFHEQDQIEELSIRIGAKRFYLQAMDPIHFEQLAAKIGELDLDAADASKALERANIDAMGSIRTTDGTSEWDRDWQGLLIDGVNPPKAIARPEVALTEEARRKGVSGKIKMSAIITKNGSIQDLKVVKGLGYGLDARALEAVRNSWEFLPAVKNGEVVETSIVFEVEFPPPQEKKPN
jgi:TonB family protein